MGHRPTFGVEMCQVLRFHLSPVPQQSTELLKKTAVEAVQFAQAMSGDGTLKAEKRVQAVQAVQDN